MDLFAISPIDGRYNDKISVLSDYFSEAALIKYRVLISIRYFEFISYHLLSSEEYEAIDFSYLNNNILANLFGDRYRAIPILKEIKNLEKVTNHDMASVIEYLKKKYLNFDCGDSKLTGYFHLGLTSQDINTSAIMMPLQKCRNDVIIPTLEKIRNKLDQMYDRYGKMMMCGFTHGQVATPTTFGHQMKVFEDRLKNQITVLEDIPITTKFGGATGGMNALRLVYKTKYMEDHNCSNNLDMSKEEETIDLKLQDIITNFVTQELGLQMSRWTTQIEPYDNLAVLCNQIRVINNILLDLCGDIWLYISKKYVKLQVKSSSEVGSSAMPHKINPIKWENAEGNLKIANCLLVELSNKLPISRLQRDLTDSTVLRNLGSVFGYCWIAWNNIIEGLDEIEPDYEFMENEVFDNIVVVSEGLQVLLRYYGMNNAYDELKKMSRGVEVSITDLLNFVNGLELDSEKKRENLKSIILNPIQNFAPMSKK